MVPANARKRRPVIEERLAQLAAYFENLDINHIEMGDPCLGIVTSGTAYHYAREVFPTASFLKLGTVWPLPGNMIREFAGRVGQLVVVEELDPFLEEQLRLMGLECVGKKIFPVEGEINPRLVRDCDRDGGLIAAQMVAAAVEAATPPPLATELPPRPPMLCPGCAHRGMFHVLQHYNVLVLGDIGCYTLGVAPPLLAVHTTGCMGASIGVAHGVDKAGSSEPRVAVIGDSTFFHAGIPALINVVYNRGATTVVVLDNRITAMTGHQDHPGSGRTLAKEPTVDIRIEDLARAVGFKKVDVIDPLDFKQTRAVVKEHLESPEPSVIIARHPCILYAREYKKPYQVDPDKCNECGVCLRIGCAPLIKVNGRTAIDPMLCVGCGLCAQICGRKAIAPANAPLEGRL
jgi:indolepyruvate ferredoxin oxidoreductase alpha subunit